MKSRITGTMLAVIAASTVFVAVAVLLANATSSARIADNARQLHWANATLGTSALARVAAGQVTMLQDGGEDENLSRAAAIATEELEGTREMLVVLSADAPEHLAEGLSALAVLLEEDPIDIDAIDAAYLQIVEPLGTYMDDMELAIRDSEVSAQMLGDVVRLSVTLILPVLAILVYRRRAAAQVRSVKIRLDAQRAADRRVARVKDDVVAGMSHELRTPLTGIYGLSEVLLAQPDDGHVDRELVTLINAEAAEMTRMVEDFITYTRIEGRDFRPSAEGIDVRAISEGVASHHRHRGLDLLVTGTAPLAKGDRQAAEQVVVNLVSNAVKHGGDHIELAINSDDDTVTLEVIDDGEGVDTAMALRLFDRFVHQDGSAVVEGSLGLGLWVARRLAELMGGTVTYERSDDRTVFSLTLPRWAHTDDTSPDIRAPREAADGKHRSGATAKVTVG